MNTFLMRPIMSQSISSTIVDKTGVKEGSAIYNTDAYNETVGVDGTSDLK